MTVPTPSIGMQEVADVLRRVARGEMTAFINGGPIEPDDNGPVVFCADGFEICVYVDVGCLDYVEWAKAPDGRYCTFDDWHKAAIRVEDGLSRSGATEPLEMLSEKEQKELQRIGEGLWRRP